ncbi:MAG: hypothetical protein DWQ36_19295 [Acidobacteria bacterium]|nr:MAG: hypothetical protein DWQ30_06345 [Acidobacteriota bacterium]REK03689.1 MAG: hypothetical protein DWQ36_19295 [Acidobacteriota bacterium]
MRESTGPEACLSGAASRRLLPGLALAVVALLGTVVPALANNSYIVNLKNGSTIISKYRPVTADFDETLMLMMTESGNTIAIEKAAIDTIVSDLENRGFGTVINTTTVVVGRSANDAAVDDEAQILQELSAYSAINNILNIGSGFDASLGSAAFGAAPAEAAPAGSIPVSFISTTTPPIGPVAPTTTIDN